MSIFAVAVILVLVGGLILFPGLAKLGRGKLASGGARTVGGTSVAAVGATLGLLGLNIQTYTQLTEEVPVAHLRLSAMDTGGYVADLTFLNSGDNRKFTLHGDDWRLESRVIKFKDWANVAGLDVVGRLDRLEGRWLTSQEELSNVKSIYDAVDFGVSSEAIEIGDVYKYSQEPALNLLTDQVIDSAYGSGVYAPMVDGAEYEVVMRPTGLIARPLNDAARTAAVNSF